MTVEADTTALRAHDGLTLHAVRWRADDTPKANVLIVHGIGEHSGRYAHVADYLTARGFSAYSLDYRGHGRSEGRRADVGTFDLAAADVKTCYDWLRSEEGNRPVFVFGHSQGTLVTLLFALAHPEAAAGVVLSATMVGMAALPAPSVWLANVLNAVAPAARLIRIAPDSLSRDPAVLQALASDSLAYHGRLPTRVIHAMIHESRRVLKRLPALTAPLLVMHGTADRLVPPRGSQLVYDAAGSPDKTLKWYEGFLHELVNEPERERVLADIVDWLDRHMS